ncbi:MAG: LTA synthase family protein [Traorella sp.]
MKKYHIELYVFISLILLELFFQLFIFHKISFDFIYQILFNASLTFFICFFSQLGTSKINRFLIGIELFLMSLLFTVEMIYYDVFDAFLSLYSILHGTGGVLQFKSQIMDAIISNIWLIIVCFIPFIVYLCIFKKLNIERSSFRKKCFHCIGMILFYGLGFVSLILPHSGLDSTLDIYLDNQPTSLMMNRFGLTTTFRSQIREQFYIYENNQNKRDCIKKEKPQEHDYGYNVMDIDFDSLIKNESDPTIKKMHEYFSKIKPTNKNEYTGMFKDYNLIMITAESFSDYAIDEKLTPTLYKMKNEGFVFNNFYNPLFGVSTSDGEYVTNVGLYPKEGVWSFSRSSDNYLPFTMGYQYRALGINTYAYHNHSYTYYDRHKSHVNIWKNYKGLGNGLDVKTTWPESDLEMIQKTSAEYMNQDRFHTYFMSVSGHKNYDWNGNMMSFKNRHYVEDLAYSEKSKAYLAANIEFDRAMEQLLKDLERYGQLDKTLIVIAPDHYPYGLSKKNIEELSNRKIEDNFDLYKSAWIIYSASMKENVVVDTYCSSIDIIPTVSNLLGFEYDSRLLMGVDVFSSTEPIVALQDYSFMNQYLKYDANKNEVKYLGNRLSDSSIKQIYGTVKKRFEMSAKVLDEDYYQIIFGND